MCNKMSSWPLTEHSVRHKDDIPTGKICPKVLNAYFSTAEMNATVSPLPRVSPMTRLYSESWCWIFAAK